MAMWLRKVRLSPSSPTTRTQSTPLTNPMTLSNMQFISILASAAALVVPSPAAAIPETTAAPSGLPEGYQWSVEDWHAGCAHSGCSYTFNVTGAISSPYPGFKAYCSGSDTGYYADCEILEGVSTSGTPFVAASLRPNVQNSIATMSVSLSFTDADSL